MNLYIAELTTGYRIPIVPNVYECALRIIGLRKNKNLDLSEKERYNLDMDIKAEEKKCFNDSTLYTTIEFIEKGMIKNLDKSRYTTNEGGAFIR